MEKTNSQRALTRYRAINYIEDKIRDGKALALALREASTRTWPDETGNYYALRTLEDWWYRYKKGGFGALYPKKRIDSGKSRSLSQETVHWVLAQIAQNPQVPVKVLYRSWLEQGKDLPSINSIYRLLKSHGYDRQGLKSGRLESGPQKSFESPWANDLWMVDYANGPSLPKDGSKRGRIRTYLCVIIDDHSRLLPFAQYYLKADTEGFHHCLKEGILRRGLPVKLYADNGGPFKNEHTSTVCANLGIRLLHARPYHSWSKGKVERVIRTIQDSYESLLRVKGNEVSSLESLNEGLSEWIQGYYHQKAHSTTKMAPDKRYRDCLEGIRTWDSGKDIDAYFYMRAQRRVRKDGTVLLDKRLYEVNLALRALKVELRYNPFNRKNIEVWHNQRNWGKATEVNLNANAELRGEETYER